jgi:hypothetical protein
VKCIGLPAKLWVSVEFIDPAYAQRLLDSQVHNRPPKPMRLRKYSQDMTDGIWPFTSQPLIISDQGHVIDGQHRLTSIIQSGVTVACLVVWGVDETVFPYLDNGAARTAGDALALRGLLDSIAPGHNGMAQALASACAYVLREKEGQEISAAACSQKQALDIIGEHPGLVAAFEHVRTQKNVVKRIGLGPATYAYYRAGQRNEAKRDEFFHGIETTAMLDEGSPILQLINWLDRALRDRKRRTKHYEKMAYIIKAWNFFEKDVTLAVKNGLQWHSTPRGEKKAREPFPKWGNVSQEPSAEEDTRRACSNCGVKGHNARGCPQKKAAAA